MLAPFLREIFGTIPSIIPIAIIHDMSSSILSTMPGAVPSTIPSKIYGYFPSTNFGAYVGTITDVMPEVF